MSQSASAPTDEDVAVVADRLGRMPQGEFTVAARDEHALPVVIENAPFLPDGRPMPTTYWLVEPLLNRLVGTIEARGGVDEAERLIGLDRIAVDHERYCRYRQSRVDAHDGPRRAAASGGVGGTRTGVKCLHAHLAHWIVAGDDAVGAWTAQELVGLAATAGRHVPVLVVGEAVREWPTDRASEALKPR